jgi:hypothetical protein
MATPTAQQARPVLDAMRSLQSESDRWTLAEALKAAIPAGLNGFDDLMRKATDEGVGGKLTKSTLRQYRDTAVRWPAGKRVKGVSFSAHREAMRGFDGKSIDGAVKLLERLARQQGSASKVTTAEVRRAVQVLQGKPVTTQRGRNDKSAGQPASGPQVSDALNDLKGGGSKLIAFIPASTDLNDLTKLQRGLAAVATHVDKLRAKKAQKNKPAQPAVAAKKTAKPAAAASSKGAAGDLRGL